MNSRTRVNLALNHIEPDHVPLDLGGSPTTGMHVSSVYILRQEFQLDPPGTPVKVVEPYQMLGEIGPDLIDLLNVDVVYLGPPRTMFGYKNENWKPWMLFDSTPVLVPEKFNTEPEPNGDILMYPEGDKAAPPSGRMPAGGFYFDSIVRQPPIDEARLDPDDNLEEFEYIIEDDLAHFRTEAIRLHEETDKAILADFGGTAFGDISLVPAPFMKNPRGIRDITEWYISTITRQDYIYAIFQRQCEIALANLEQIYDAVGDLIHVVFMTGTDFGMQTGLLTSPEVYRKLYKPFHLKLNDWVHRHTQWKTLNHSCGSVVALIPDFIEAGFDVLNPVQTSAAGMDPRELKQHYGDRITFWGGGVDTQGTLPFGTPDEVRAQVKERIEIFSPNGGFVFNTIHNVQAGIPRENLLALYQAVADFR